MPGRRGVGKLEKGRKRYKELNGKLRVFTGRYSFYFSTLTRYETVLYNRNSPLGPIYMGTACQITILQRLLLII